MAEKIEELRLGFLEVGPSQIIQEFKVCVEDTSTKPFEQRCFVQLKAISPHFEPRILQRSVDFSKIFLVKCDMFPVNLKIDQYHILQTELTQDAKNLNCSLRLLYSC